MTMSTRYGSIINDDPAEREALTKDHDEASLREDDFKRPSMPFLVSSAFLFLVLVAGCRWSHEAYLGPATMQMLGSAMDLDMKPRYPKELKKPHYYEQLVDHDRPEKGFFKQRYFEQKSHFQGPGHPIFVVLGGEVPVKQFLYPFISEVLALRWGAYALNPEHRYFGESYPIKHPSKKEIRQQMTVSQALQDYMRLIKAKQAELGCGPRGTPTYCPVLTVGASYAGLLSVLARHSFSDVVDMGYGASPCVHLFDHSVSPNTYYDYITTVADRISPGCPQAIHQTLEEVKADLSSISTHQQQHLKAAAQTYGICSTLPSWIGSGADLADVIVDYNAVHFSDVCMDYYPPGPEPKFGQACELFQDATLSTPEKIQQFFSLIEDSTNCHNMEDPGEAEDEFYYWDALCCHLAPMIGKSSHTAWYAQPYNLEDDIQLCQEKFGIDLDETEMVREYDLNDFSQQTRLLMTNGYNDGWYPLSYTEPPGDGVVVMTFENGAHRSELQHELLPMDTPDIAQGHQDISDLIGEWLQQIREEGEAMHA